MSEPIFVGLDLGTSGVKGIAVSASREVLGEARWDHPTSRPLPGRAEQEPADWFQAAREVVAALSIRVPAETWAGIGLAGMIPTLVLVDESGDSVGPAITWEDDRAEEEGPAFRDAFGADEVYRCTGQWVDGRYLAPMWRWVMRHEPDRAARARRLLSAKDFQFARLTGVVATDPSTASGFGCFAVEGGRWDDGLAADLLPLLPEVRPSTWTAPLGERAATDLGIPTGIPVVLGAADSVAGAFAVGAVRPGDCASLWGTSTVILGVSGSLVLDPRHRYLVTPLAQGVGWGLEMDLVSTGSAMRWVAALLGLDGEDRLLELASRSPLGSRGVQFLPFLGFGEQGSRWDPALRGSLHGLTLAHAPRDIARALVEGIVLEHRRCLDVLDEAGVFPREVCASGGPLGSAFFASLLADAAGRAVVPVDIRGSASALGAALLAAAACGVEVSPASSPDKRVEPDGETRARWDEMSAAREELLASMRAKA